MDNFESLAGVAKLSSLQELILFDLNVNSLAELAALPSLEQLLVFDLPNLEELGGDTPFVSLSSFTLGRCDGLVNLQSMPEMPILGYMRISDLASFESVAGMVMVPVPSDI
jgi:hypothetical protein